MRYMRKKHNLLIREEPQRDIKIKICTTYPLIEDETLQSQRKKSCNRTSETVTVTSTETEESTSRLPDRL